MDIPESVSEAITAALHDSVIAMLGLPEVLNPLLEQHVRSLVNAGELVPRERLQVGAQVELAPIGLERAARGVLAIADGTDVPDELSDALKLLAAVFEPPDEPEPEAPPEPSEAVVEPPASDDEELDLKCSKCGDEIDAEQALLSNTRWGEVLCRTHHIEKSEARQKERETK